MAGVSPLFRTTGTVRFGSPCIGVNPRRGKSTRRTPLAVKHCGTDANGLATYEVSASDNGPGTRVLRVLPPSAQAPGVPHNFLYVLPVEPERGTVYGDGLETMRRLGAHNRYHLTIIEPSFAIDPWYADNPKDPNTWHETFMTKELVHWVRWNLAVTGQEQTG